MNPDDQGSNATPADKNGPCPGGPETPEGYGRQPGTREAICAFAKQIETILEKSPRTEVAAAVADAMGPVLKQEQLLDEAHCACQPETYRRHVLFADPTGRFTILALAWRPGQATPVHGHRAWGAVGVYEGTPNVALYDCAREAEGEREAVLKSDTPCKPGDTSFVQPGYSDVHRIYNATDARVITIHVYGRDLVDDPNSINLLLSA